MATRRTTTTTTTTAPPVGAEVASTLELATAPTLDVDQQLRIAALQAAATAAVRAPRPETILATARTFEAYLRGNQ